MKDLTAMNCKQEFGAKRDFFFFLMSKRHKNNIIGTYINNKFFLATSFLQVLLEGGTDA